jgi:hypothetical protein
MLLDLRQSNDAIFANIDAMLGERTQGTRAARFESSPPARAEEEVRVATPPEAPPAPRTLPEPASAQAAVGYQPDGDKRRTVYFLAVAMAAISLYCLVPAVSHLNLAAAPNWARAALLLSLLQLAYAAWLASIPDWAALRSSMILFTVVAALYGVTMTITLSTPLENPLPLELSEVRRQAVLWCASVVLLSSLLAYGCGRAAWRWRRMLQLFHG